MSTRSVIAVAESPMKWEGKYHHWDGYPEGLGKAIMQAYEGDVNELVRAFLNEEVHHWSTAVGYNMKLPVNHKPEGADVCAECGEVEWRHWKQNYEKHGEKAPDVEDYMVFGHPFRDPYYSGKLSKDLYGPVAHLKNDEGEEWICSSENASGSGCEYAYVFVPNGESYQNKVYILSSFRRDGSKMIGMFGSGDPDSAWLCIGYIDLEEQTIRVDSGPRNTHKAYLEAF